MKFEKQVSWKVAIALILVASLISSSVTYYVFAVSPTTPFNINAGIYPGAPSYTIWKEGTNNYFAKDANGFITFSGMPFTATFDSVLNAMSTHGGKILLKPGYYEGYCVIDRDGIFLEGEGCWATQTDLTSEPPPTALYGTVIKPPEGKNGIEITNWGGDDEVPGKWKYGIQIRDLGIWFTTASTGHGITTGTPYNKTTVTNFVVENIKILNNDKNHYGLQLCNFLYSTFKNIMVWGGPMLEIYSNSWLHQGNSIFDELFNRINYDLQSVEHVGPYPIFIHRNASIYPGDTMFGLSELRRIQVNNPIHQTGDRPSEAFWEAYIADVRHCTFVNLNLEGVNDNKVRMGTAYSITFTNAYIWTMDPGDSLITISSDTEYITWIDSYLEDVQDGNTTNAYINCDILGDIDLDTKASFINLDGNSGYAKLLYTQTSLNVTCRFLAVNSLVLLTIITAGVLEAGEFLKVAATSGVTNTFIVTCGDEGPASRDIGFFWQVIQIP